jgi:hypothetical protein
MGLSNAIIKTAPTSITVSGGSDVALFVLKPYSQGKMTLAPNADTDFRTRRTIEITSKSPEIQASAPNGYTQQRTVFRFVKPKLLANGKLTTNTVTINIGYDIEATAAERQELLDVAAQLCSDADFTPVVLTGATS